MTVCCDCVPWLNWGSRHYAPFIVHPVASKTVLFVFVANAVCSGVYGFTNIEKKFDITSCELSRSAESLIPEFHLLADANDCYRRTGETYKNNRRTPVEQPNPEYRCPRNLSSSDT